MTEPKLTMKARGASAEEVQRGVEAALAVFARHNTTAVEVADALAARNLDEMMGAFVPPELMVTGGSPPEPTATDRQMQIADIWYEAEEAAANACYSVAREKPRDAQLVLLPLRRRTLRREERMRCVPTIATRTAHWRSS